MESLDRTEMLVLRVSCTFHLAMMCHTAAMSQAFVWLGLLHSPESTILSSLHAAAVGL